MRKLYFILLILLASSCTPNLQIAIEVATETEANAEATITAIHKEQRIVGANFAARYYPPKESEQTETEYVPGNAEELKAELQRAVSESDSLKRYLATLEVKEECLPEVQERDAVINRLQGRIAQLNTQASNLQADLKRITTTKTQVDTAPIDSARIMASRHQEARKAAEAKEQEKVQENEELQADLTKAYVFAGIVLLLMAGMFYWFVIWRR